MQLYVLPTAPAGKQLKNRSRDEFGVEHAYYCSAGNRRAYVFPLFELPDAAERFLKEMLASDTDYDHELLPDDPGNAPPPPPLPLPERRTAAASPGSTGRFPSCARAALVLARCTPFSPAAPFRLHLKRTSLRTR